MAVIIDMDMPMSCSDCEFHRLESGFPCILTNNSKCPLKSADKMIAEIRECAYDEPEGYVCFCDREPDKIVSLEDVEDIIHKYTKEQNND